MKNKQKMIESLLICEQHKEIIQFVCHTTQWHFHFLCRLCIPSHSHPPKLILIEEIVLQATNNRLQLREIVSKLQRLISFFIPPLLKQQEQNIVKDCYSFKNSMTLHFTAFLDQKIYQKYCFRFQKEFSLINSRVLDFISQSNLFQLSQFSSQHIQQVKIALRKLYFADNLLMQANSLISKMQSQFLKLQTSQINILLNKCLQQILSDKDEQNKNNQQDTHHSKDQNSTVSKLQQQKLCQKEQLKQIDVQKKTKIKQHIMRKCLICQHAMEYLTQNKKHLICRNCGGKQRNYTKKQISK